ncbi:MAG TPA: hypothetical protein PK225_03755 [Azonexus sp.]|nr:hypothetical protein [Azonexus sp.]
MTIGEFRAWLDGFKEGINEAPTPDQWAKVLEKFGQVYEPLPQLPFGRPNIIGPYWSPSIPPNVPGWPSVTCGSITAPNDPTIRATN